MKVDQVGAVVPDQPSDPAGEGEIQVAAHRHRDHLDAVRIVSAGAGAPLGTDQQTPHAPLGEATDKVSHLERATVKMASGLDVEDFHRDVTGPVIRRMLSPAAATGSAAGLTGVHGIKGAQAGKSRQTNRAPRRWPERGAGPRIAGGVLPTRRRPSSMRVFREPPSVPARCPLPRPPKQPARSHRWINTRR